MLNVFLEYAVKCLFVIFIIGAKVNLDGNFLWLLLREVQFLKGSLQHVVDAAKRILNFCLQGLLVCLYLLLLLLVAYIA